MRTRCPQSELIGNWTQASICLAGVAGGTWQLVRVLGDESQFTGVPGQIMSDLNTFS